MSRPVIGMILESGFPPDIRVEKEIRALQNGGFDVSVLCEATEKDPVGESIWEGARITRIATPEPKTSQFYVERSWELLTLKKRSWVAGIDQFIDKVKPRFIHVHDLLRLGVA